MNCKGLVLNISYGQLVDIKTMNALIVDDEEDIGQMVSRFLGREGLEASYFTTISSARDAIRKSIYDYYFLDLNLPDGSGFDLVSLIKERNTSAKIIAISAYDGLREIKRARDLGIDEFIKKPFSKKDILNAVKSPG